MDKTNYNRFPFLTNTFNKTSLDLETPIPIGGPINDISSGFTQIYTPTNKYLDSKLTSKVKGTSKNENSFQITGLDLENPNAGTKQGGTGGPNRTNSNNRFNTISNGQYQNKRSPNLFGFKFSNANIDIKNKEGKVVTTQLQQYTPKASYMDSFRGKIFDV